MCFRFVIGLDVGERAAVTWEERMWEDCGDDMLSGARC